MKNRKIKRTLKNHVAAAVLTLLAVVTVLLIWKVDVKSSHLETKDYAPKNNEAAEKERRFIPVPYETFVELVESYKTIHRVELDGMGSPQYFESDTLFIDVSNMKKIGLSLLIGTNMATRDWFKGTLCFFKTQEIDSVVVVNCPADLLAKLVCSKETH